VFRLVKSFSRSISPCVFETEGDGFSVQFT
jgi:hypothetical protein